MKQGTIANACRILATNPTVSKFVPCVNPKERSNTAARTAALHVFQRYRTLGMLPVIMTVTIHPISDEIRLSCSESLYEPVYFMSRF